MALIKDISEYYLLSSIIRFQKLLSSPKSHKRVVIKDKTKERVVYVPSKIVKLAQKYVLRNFLEEIRCSDNVFSYRTGKSIVEMAAFHSDNNHFLHLDIKNYFDSMDWDVFKKVIESYFSNSELGKIMDDTSDLHALKRILTFRNRFRQGSVTSPYISNIYLYDFDNYMEQYVSNLGNNAKYSRYSDDIYISSKSTISQEVINEVKKQLKLYKLRLNYPKIKFFRIDNRVKILGLSLNKERRITVNTSYKKNLKKLIYKTLNVPNFKVNYNHLFGKIYYLMMCDPKYFNYLQTKYKDEHGVSMIDRIKEKESEAKIEMID